MKILIVGSKGFLGSHIYKYFSAKKNISCYAADIVVDYTDLNYLLLDAQGNNFDEVFNNRRFEVCINCSGAASVQDSVLHLLRDFNLNAFNVFKILEAIKKYTPACKFINLSSAAVYGQPKRLPVQEDDECQPLSPYGMHKMYAENICKEFYDFFGVQTCSARIFSAYGPGLKKQLLWDIFQKSLSTNELILFGSGNETRDFIYVEDIVQSLDRLVENAAFNASIYNVANGCEISVNESAKLLLKELGYMGRLLFSGNERAGDPMHWKADITKIESAGYKQTISFEQGIRKYVKWLKEEKLV